ncbi:disA bacterial checkpoint controller nucleotide-binding domain-containing protein [Ditylenchus destructor]|nr:disA bacterial checkpoint controller nucleotide-binding domain-containing protein [Ditylenchus destructor]
MADIFKNKKSPLHDGALVIHLFDKPTIYSASSKLPMDNMHNWQKVASVSAQEANLDKFGTRHWSACSASHYCPRAIVVVVSEERGRVSVFKGGNVELGVTKKKLVQELLTVFQENSDVSLFQRSLYNIQHFRAKVTTQLFDPNYPSDVEWYFDFVTKCRLQLYKGKEYKDGAVQPDMSVEAYECKQKEIRKANETRLMKLKYIDVVKLKRIFYGGMPFGGIRYTLNYHTRTIDLDLLNAFVEREHFQNGLMAYILREQFFKEFYPFFVKITFRFEPHLKDRIEKFVYDLNIEVDSSDKQFLYYTLPLSGANNTGPNFLYSSGLAYVNPVVPMPSTPPNPSLVEENCESLVIRVRKEDIFLQFDVAITKRINWIQPNSILEKQMMVGDKVVGINGVEFSMELKDLERMYQNELQQCSERKRKGEKQQRSRHCQSTPPLALGLNCPSQLKKDCRSEWTAGPTPLVLVLWPLRYAKISLFV